jgi:hypothetical protein
MCKAVLAWPKYSLISNKLGTFPRCKSYSQLLSLP